MNQQAATHGIMFPAGYAVLVKMFSQSQREIKAGAGEFTLIASATLRRVEHRPCDAIADAESACPIVASVPIRSWTMAGINVGCCTTRAECQGRVDGADAKVATATSPWLIQGYAIQYNTFMIHCITSHNCDT